MPVGEERRTEALSLSLCYQDLAHVNLDEACCATPGTGMVSLQNRVFLTSGVSYADSRPAVTHADVSELVFNNF